MTRKDDTKAVSTYLPKTQVRKIRAYAAAQNVTIQSVYEEALRAFFEDVDPLGDFLRRIQATEARIDKVSRQQEVTFELLARTLEAILGQETRTSDCAPQQRKARVSQRMKEVFQVVCRKVESGRGTLSYFEDLVD